MSKEQTVIVLDVSASMRTPTVSVPGTPALELAVQVARDLVNRKV